MLRFFVSRSFFTDGSTTRDSRLRVSLSFGIEKTVTEISHLPMRVLLCLVSMAQWRSWILLDLHAIMGEGIGGRPSRNTGRGRGMSVYFLSEAILCMC